MQNLKNPAFLIRASVLSCIALLPFLVMPVGWAGVGQAKLLLLSAVVLLSIGAWAYESYRARAIVWPHSWIALSVLAIPVVYFLSALLSSAPPSSYASGTGEQDTVATVALLGALSLLAAVAFRGRPDAATGSVRALYGGGLVLMLIQVFHVFVPSVSFGVLASTAASVFGSWHEVGILAGLFVILTTILWESEILSGMWKKIAIPVALLSVFMLFVVNMADVWYVLGASLVLLGGFGFARSRSFSRIIVVALALGALSIIAGLGGPRIYEALPARMQVLQVEVRPSWEGTFSIGKDAMTNTRAALFGSGPNTFTRQWSLYKPLGVNATEFWNVDFNTGVGFIPTTFVTVGILGLLSWLALLGVVFWRFVRNVRLSGRSEDAVRDAVFGAILFLAAFHILYVPTIALSALIFLLLGILAARDDSHGSRAFALGDKPGMAIVAGGVVVAALCGLAALATVRATVSDLLVNRSAVAYSATQKSDEALSLLKAALVVDGSNDRAHRAAVELGIIRLAELNAAAQSEDATAQLQASLQTTIQHGLSAVSINSGDYRNWLALAGLYRDLAGAGVQGAYENARAAYEKAFLDNPKNPLPLVQLAQLAIAQNNMQEAATILDQAIALKSNFSAAYLLRSQARSALNQDQAAIQDASVIVQAAPEDPLGWYNLGGVLYEAGLYREASQALEQAVALQSEYANALFTLGLAYDQLGRTQDALSVLERVQSKNPGNQVLEQVIESIRAKLRSSQKSAQ
jgi:tetratricopeptide (TPR) repeat protein